MPSLIQDKSGVFYIVYTLQRKRVWRSLQTKNRHEAFRRFVDKQSSPPSRSLPTFSQTQEEYLSYVRATFRPKTYEVYQKTLKNFSRYVGQKLINEIAARDIEHYKAHRKEVVSPHTVNHELRGIRAFFNKLKD